jgi:hypothetical protein
VINQLDEMLQELLSAGLNNPPLPWPVDVEVRPPDDSWRATVNASGRPAVSVYMAEVRESRDWRSTQATERRVPEPFRVECHYLISTWIPTADPGFASPTVVEDWLLGEVLLILVDAAPLNASEIYGAALPPTLSEVLIDNPLRTEIVPAEGYPNLSDFWTGVGSGNIWHPSAHLIVTLPLDRTSLVEGPPVTTLHTSYGSEAIIHIGGTVSDGAGDPVPGAWVRLSDSTGAIVVQTAETDDLGQFRLYGLIGGGYLISAGSATIGGHSPPAPVTVPDPLGSYDLILT